VVARGTPRGDHVLVLTAANATEAELARGVLAAAGIPALLHTSSWFGRALDDEKLLRPRVFVPKGALARARTALDEAWGDAWHARAGTQA
jgi:hypothetical protein